MSQTQCPRMIESGGVFRDFVRPENRPDDGTCDYCGSLLPDEFMRRIEAGDVILGPTDKSYKVYVRNAGGAPFRQSYRTDSPGTIDRSRWTYTTRDIEECKFYFQHLSPDQCKRFVELLNSKTLRLDYPGHFYRLPYFIVQGPQE